MNICKVQGKVVSTIKDEKLEGFSFLIVRRLGKSERAVGHPFVVLDQIGCGAGDIVLVTQGANARFALAREAPVDAVVIGVVDSYNTN